MILFEEKEPGHQATEGCGIRKEECGRRNQKGKKNWEACNTLEKLFFPPEAWAGLCATTELRQDKLSEGPVLIEVVLKEKMRHRQTDKKVSLLPASYTKQAPIAGTPLVSREATRLSVFPEAPNLFHRTHDRK